MSAKVVYNCAKSNARYAEPCDNCIRTPQAVTACERAAAQLRDWGYRPDADALRRIGALAPVDHIVPLWQWIARYWVEHPEER